MNYLGYTILKTMENKEPKKNINKITGFEVIANPNGANGTTSDEREQVCWNYYVESLLANGKGNGQAAALKAGYTRSSARQITTRNWFIARLQTLRRKTMFVKAEKVLHKTLNMEAVDEEGHTDVQLLRVQTDVAKFITSTQGKNSGYSTKTDDAMSKMVDMEQTPEQELKAKLFEKWLKEQTQ